MRTLIDIPEQQIRQLTEISRQKGLSRAEVVRQAIAAYLVANRAAPSQAFGLWGERKIDGLKYQRKLRSEW
jgi:metal-responsive CopG/Arc/MetJ family transcriptional regulator